MKKILEYYRGDILAPTGGAKGYLYGLNKGLEKINNKEFQIEYLPGKKSVDGLRSYSKTSKNCLIKWLLKIYRRIKHINKNLAILNRQLEPSVDISQYDAIHFHSACDIYMLRGCLKKYNGKVLLTSHSPQPSSNEYIESSSKLELFLFGKKYKKLIEIDKYAFNRADYIIFPCEYAEEPYYKYWSDYADVKENKKDVYKYLLTGTFPAKVKTSREDIRKKYGIPEDAFVISYVGRHNEIKGYDKLKEIGNVILEKHANVYFLVAGNLGPIESLKHDRWIEIGWTTEPHSYTAASDVFVLPNKETYFDLVLLEVLSTGTILVASKTGGNKFFENEAGVQLYEDVDEAVQCIEKIMDLSKSELSTFSSSNRDLFYSMFTPEIFAQSYLQILQECDI